MTAEEIEALQTPNDMTEEVIQRLVQTVVPPPRRRSPRFETPPLEDAHWHLGSTGLRRSARLSPV